MTLFPHPIKDARAETAAWKRTALKALVEHALAVDVLARQRKRMAAQATEHLQLMAQVRELEAENGSLCQALDLLVGNAPADAVVAPEAGQTVVLPRIRDAVGPEVDRTLVFPRIRGEVPS